MKWSLNTYGHHLLWFWFFFFFLRRKLVDDQTHLHWFHLSGKLLKGPLLEYDQLKLKCYKLHESAPSMKLTFSWWGGLSTKKFQQNCINEESSPEPCTWVNTLGKIRKTFSSYSFPLGVMSFARFNWHSFAQLPAWRFLLWLSMKWRERKMPDLLVHLKLDVQGQGGGRNLDADGQKG